MIEIALKCGKLECPAKPILSREAFNVYKRLNPEHFDDLYTFEWFKQCLELLIQAHHQNAKVYVMPKHLDYLRLSDNNRVLLAFSGGLDSVYQAFRLKEEGYDVCLFHCKNMNYYTNGQEAKRVEEFAKKYNFNIVYGKMTTNWKATKYKKFWKENSWKDMLFYSMMFDYCIENDIRYISSGDDLRLSINDAVVGTNLSDARELTLAYVDGIRELSNVNFLFVDSKEHKGKRLAKLIEKGALDDYYSCVNPGKFNQLNHNRVEARFGVKLEQYNCGVCRKCAFHNLLRHYYLGENFNPEFIDFCWNKIANGADNVFFNEKLTLEERIKNLYNY